MTIDIDKFSDEIAGAVLDVIEEERRINRSDISAVIKKVTKGYIDKMQPSYGGFGVGAFMVVGSSYKQPDYLAPGAVVGVTSDGRLYDCRSHPLLPDAD